jgi:hypothetical protein
MHPISYHKLTTSNDAPAFVRVYRHGRQYVPFVHFNHVRRSGNIWHYRTTEGERRTTQRPGAIWDVRGYSSPDGAVSAARRIAQGARHNA